PSGGLGEVDDGNSVVVHDVGMIARRVEDDLARAETYCKARGAFLSRRNGDDGDVLEAPQAADVAPARGQVAAEIEPGDRVMARRIYVDGIQIRKRSNGGANVRGTFAWPDDGRCCAAGLERERIVTAGQGDQNRRPIANGRRARLERRPIDAYELV